MALVAQGAGCLPIVALLSLISARRGNASFCIWGAHMLLKLDLALCLAGPVWLGASYFAEVSPYGAPFSQAVAPLFHRAGMGWSTSFLAWIMATALVVASYLSLKGAQPGSVDRCELKALQFPLIFCLLAAACFFLVQVLLYWPFGGFPEGMEESRAIMAILRHAMRAYFMGFCIAGGLGLAFLTFLEMGMDSRHCFIATRWLAFWAACGCLPHILVTWGASLGVGLRSPGAFAQSLLPQTVALAPLTLALACWSFLLWKPQYLRFLAWLGLCLLAVRPLMPALLKIL